MIKWIVVSRPKPGMTTERFFYEWAVIHVALMFTNVAPFRSFRRYVQHFGFQDIPAAARVLPQHALAWESFSEHWLEQIDDLGPAVSSEEYRGHMQPHSFSDSAMELHLLRGTPVYESPDFRSGGVKLIHSLKAGAGLSRDAFDEFLSERHAPRVSAMLAPRGLRKYEINRQLGLDASRFKGTLFEKGGVDAYAGVEEFWFDSLEEALAVGRDSSLRSTLLESYGHFVDVSSSHSMYVVERSVFDFVTREATPAPAILDPTSCEARACSADWKSYLPALNRPTQ